MNWELERKFLIEDIPQNMNSYKSVLIEQTYLVITEDSSSRVRKLINLDNDLVSYTFTYKYGSAPKRKEEEFEIDSKMYKGFLEMFRRKPLKKIRNYYIYNKTNITVDIYKNTSINGLITAEVEFVDENIMEQYNPPLWFGDEVTGVKKYGNKYLWRLIQKERKKSKNT